MAVERAAPTLTVLSRSHCGLCEEMVEGLRALQARHAFEIEVVDVDADPALRARYGVHIPVLLHERQELCRHHLDHTAVTDYLAGFG